jgi:hypothetical protein
MFWQAWKKIIVKNFSVLLPIKVHSKIIVDLKGQKKRIEEQCCFGHRSLNFFVINACLCSENVSFLLMFSEIDELTQQSAPVLCQRIGDM